MTPPPPPPVQPPAQPVPGATAFDPSSRPAAWYLDKPTDTVVWYWDGHAFNPQSAPRTNYPFELFNPVTGMPAPSGRFFGRAPGDPVYSNNARVLSALTFTPLPGTRWFRRRVIILLSSVVFGVVLLILYAIFIKIAAG